MNNYFDMSEKIHNIKFRVTAVHRREDTDIMLVSAVPTVSWEDEMEPLIYAVSDEQEVKVGDVFAAQVTEEKLYQLGYGPPPSWVEVFYMMEAALDHENYEAAAVLRDTVKEMKGDERG